MNFLKLFAIMLILTAEAAIPAGEELFQRNTPVRVTYQYRTGKTWSSSTAILRGAVTEEMIANQLSARHSAAEVRILRAEANSERPVRVQYRYRMPRHTVWTHAGAMLTGARTISMARNQLLAKHPGCEVQILGCTAPPRAEK